MKKLIIPFCVILLIACLAVTCYAEGLQPEGQNSSAYAYSTYRYNGPSAGSRIIAGMIVAGVAAGIRAIFGGKKENKSAEGTVQPKEEPISEEKFICRNCGKTSSGWYSKCPNCGAVDQMEENKKS